MDYCISLCNKNIFSRIICCLFWFLSYSASLYIKTLSTVCLLSVIKEVPVDDAADTTVFNIALQFYKVSSDTFWTNFAFLYFLFCVSIYSNI